MQKEYLVDLEDAVVAVKDAEGKLKLHQSVPLTAMGASQGGFWGLLIGLLFGAPIFQRPQAALGILLHGFGA